MLVIYSVLGMFVVTLEKRVSIPSVFVNNAAGVDMAERSFPDVQYVM